MRQNQLYRHLTMRGDNYNLHPANSPNAAVYHMDCKECCSYIVPFLDRTARLERNSCSGTLNAGSILLNIWGSNVWEMRAFNNSSVMEIKDLMEMLLKRLTSIAILAHTPRCWKFYTAIPIKAAIVLAIQDTAIFTNVWRGALTCPKAITYSLWFPRK